MDILQVVIGLARVMCITSKKDQSPDGVSSDEETYPSKGETLGNDPKATSQGDAIIDIRDMVKASQNETQHQNRNVREWRIVAKVFDRIFFLVYLVITVIPWIIIFLKA